MRKIHFINRIDQTNAGDLACCPLNYFYDYFSQFNIIRHDIDFIDFNIIESDDIVILGGSGMLNVSQSFNININKLLAKCKNVIGWSIGFNTHNKLWFIGSDFQEINYNKFKLIGIRDFNHPSKLPYLPCPSVFAFSKSSADKKFIKRKFGIIKHKDLQFDIPIDADTILNNYSIKEIEKFISESECIITNSYHCAYWSLLLNRKAIVINKFSTKFDFYKYKPEMIELNTPPLEDDASNKKFRTTLIEKLNNCYNVAKTYETFYSEAINANNSFFEKVKCIIEELNIPKSNDFQNLYQLTTLQLWNRQMQYPKLRRDMNEKIEKLENQIKDFQYELKKYKQKNKLEMLITSIKEYKQTYGYKKTILHIFFKILRIAK